MKTGFILIGCVVFGLQAPGQTYSIRIDTVQPFEHSALITTHTAIEEDLLVCTASYLTEATYEVDLTSKTLILRDWAGKESEFPINSVNSTKALLNLTYLLPDDTEVSMIVDHGLDPATGIVIFMRWNDMVEDVPKTLGWYSTNIGFTADDASP